MSVKEVQQQISHKVLNRRIYDKITFKQEVFDWKAGQAEGS